MAAYDDKMKHLQEAADRAIEWAESLTDDEWPDEESRERLRKVLAYAQLMIAASDGALVEHDVGSSLQAALNEFVESSAQAASEPEIWIDRLLQRIRGLPPAQGHDLEQRAKDAATKFGRSARQRVSAVEKQADQIKQEVDETGVRINELNDQSRTAMTERLDELRSSIEQIQTTFEGRIQQYESTLETEREESLKQRREQADEFNTAQTERAEQANARLDALVADLTERSDQALQGLETSRERVADLIDRVTLAGTAGGFGDEAHQQKAEADKWRGRAIALGVIAAFAGLGIAIYAIVDEIQTPLIGAALILIGLAGYAAKQSSEHREREVRARRLEIEMAAFGPYMEAVKDLTKEQEARMEFMKRVFVGESALPDKKSDPAAAITSNDVSVIGQLFDVFRKAAK